MNHVLRSILLTIATLGSSWAAFQAARWSGEQARAFDRANALRSASVRESNRAFQIMQVDVTSFATWALAIGQRNDEGASFLRRRFRREFAPTFERWLATSARPGEPPEGTPFQRADYKLTAQDEATRLLGEADAAAEAAGRYNDISDQFMFSVVLLSTVIFLAGTESGGGTPPSSRRFRVVITLALLVVACGFMLRLPQRIPH